MSPFEAVYGQKPPSLRSYITGSTPVASLDNSESSPPTTSSFERELGSGSTSHAPPCRQPPSRQGFSNWRLGFTPPLSLSTTHCAQPLFPQIGKEIFRPISYYQAHRRCGLRARPVGKSQDPPGLPHFEAETLLWEPSCSDPAPGILSNGYLGRASAVTNP